MQVFCEVGQLWDMSLRLTLHRIDQRTILACNMLFKVREFGARYTRAQEAKLEILAAVV